MNRSRQCKSTGDTITFGLIQMHSVHSATVLAHFKLLQLMGALQQSPPHDPLICIVTPLPA